MKKVIRLTERQLEDIVRRVISEQQDEGQHQRKQRYGLEQIKDNETYNKFVNFADGSYETAMNTLNNLGLKKGQRQLGGRDSKDILIGFFNSGLSAVAKTGITDPKLMKSNNFIEVLNSELNRPHNYNDVVAYYPNYCEVLSKVALQQLQKIS